ncbi:MAG TPA: hypothetical protein P5081_24100 [Phycisphaerae bacterium]|nr:hypothetical protein [Phycisphaerae bacterium]HRW55969.1 hypothetical protein [Phycisphaerae bacterium]
MNSSTPCESTLNRRRNTRSSARLRNAVILACIVTCLGADGECPKSFELLPSVFQERVIYTETFSACASCGLIGDVVPFQSDVAPELSMSVDFTITSPDALTTSDAFVELVLTCGAGVDGERRYPVTLRQDTVTRLIGLFVGDAGELCIDDVTGQRSPARWSVSVVRTTPDDAPQSVQFQWEVDYIEYQPGGQ